MFGRTGKNNPLYGRHPSEEIRKKLSESHKGEKNHNFGKFGKEHPGSIKVICVETGEVFDSIREIERKYKYFHGDISKCCKGKQNTCGKLHWQYFKK